jgi:hypothetical protein
VAVVAGIIALLTGWLGSVGRTPTVRVWAAVALLGFYFSTSEWSHCQRDVWMLLPALAATLGRGRQVAILASERGTPGRVAARALVEGLCWAVAFWIKPHVAVPAFTCWTVGAALVTRMKPGAAGLLAVDLVGLVTGSLLAGGLGILYLYRSGSWSSFLEILLHWNPGYLRTHVDPTSLTTYVWSLLIFFPWGLVPVAAVPIAVALIVQGLSAARPWTRPDVGQGVIEPALLAGLYLGWLVQLFLLQNSRVEYNRVPAVLLGIGIVFCCAPPPSSWARRGVAVAIALGLALFLLYLAAIQPAVRPALLTASVLALMAAALFGALTFRDSPRLRRIGAAVVVTASALFVTLAAWNHPLLRRDRVALWGRCFVEGSTPAVRNALTLTDRTDWVRLEEVAGFLRARGPRDGELTCYDNGTITLYADLGLRPSTRYVHLNHTIDDSSAPYRREICRALASSSQRFVVQDLLARGKAADGGPPATPAAEWEAVFPWPQPVVFRSGRYLVHEVIKPVERCWPGDPSLLAVGTAERHRHSLDRLK